MIEVHEELVRISDRLDQLAERGKEAAIQDPLERLKKAAEEIGETWSRSWVGYHANVYYAEFLLYQLNGKVFLQHLAS